MPVMYQDVMQAIRDGVDAAEVESMIADEKSHLTDTQMDRLREELRQRDDKRPVKYGVKIQTGTGAYRWLAGWDDTYQTRAEAEACAKRASQNDGWSARVVELEED